MQNSLFKFAKKKQFLVDGILKNLLPVNERPHKMPQIKDDEPVIEQSWDFSDETVLPPSLVEEELISSSESISLSPVASPEVTAPEVTAPEMTGPEMGLTLSGNSGIYSRQSEPSTIGNFSEEALRMTNLFIEQTDDSKNVQTNDKTPVTNIKRGRFVLCSNCGTCEK